MGWGVKAGITETPWETPVVVQTRSEPRKRETEAGCPQKQEGQRGPRDTGDRRAELSQGPVILGF
jgi:hypothetical protein